MTDVSQFGSFAPTQVIRLLVTDNPKKPSGKSFTRFALYQDGMTIARYVEASVAAGHKATVAVADLRWDVAHKFIEVSEADTVPATEPAPEAKPAKTKLPVSRPKAKKKAA